jgi:hypothetical protein
VSTSPPVGQWLRQAQLILTPNNTNTNSSKPTGGAGTSGAPFVFSTGTTPPAITIDLPGVGPSVNGNQDVSLRFVFQVTAADTEAPNMLVCRVYNLGQNTINTIIQEYTGVVLQAGYENGAQFGIIFQGNVSQYVRGKENNVDSFLEIRAGDGDAFYNFGFASVSLPAGTPDAGVVSTIGKQTGTPVDPNALDLLSASPTGGVMPRGQVLFGLYRNMLRDIATSNSARWSVQNGVITIIPLTGYLPGEAVVINSATGMVGVPEATDLGVKVRCLLNANIKIGQRIQINEKDVTYTVIKDRLAGYPNYEESGKQYTANVTRDGFYRVMVANHSGDTRGGAWYTDLVCLAIDPSAVGKNVVNVVGTLGSVKGYGG